MFEEQGCFHYLPSQGWGGPRFPGCSLGSGRNFQKLSFLGSICGDCIQWGCGGGGGVARNLHLLKSPLPWATPGDSDVQPGLGPDPEVGADSRLCPRPATVAGTWYPVLFSARGQGGPALRKLLRGGVQMVPSDRRRGLFPWSLPLETVNFKRLAAVKPNFISFLHEASDCWLCPWEEEHLGWYQLRMFPTALLVRGWKQCRAYKWPFKYSVLFPALYLSKMNLWNLQPHSFSAHLQVAHASRLFIKWEMLCLTPRAKHFRGAKAGGASGN